jgi:peptide chain release factor 2
MSWPWRLTSSSRSRCSGGVFDWEPALRKLDELNAKVEDPTLWDRPAEAQAVSRERSKLEASIGAVKALERERADAIELAELAEMEGDTGVGDEAAASLRGLKDRAGQQRL